MPLFVCDKCHAIENSALGAYWYRKYVEKKDSLCSECMPKNSMGEGGKWHNHFTRDTATPELIKEIGESNFVYVADIPGVIAKNVCCGYVEPKKPIVPRGEVVKLTCNKCKNTFKAKKDSICKKCGEGVKYE